MATRFTEQANHAPDKVDRERGVIAGVKVLGFESSNGRRYVESAVDAALGLYEDARVNIDHELKTNARGFMEGVGVLRNVNRRPDGVYADLHLIQTHPATPIILEKAEKFPAKFGLSHSATGRTAYRDGKTIVEAIESVESVDIVDRPATTKGLFESEQLVKITFAQLFEQAEYTHGAKLLEMLPTEMGMDAEVAAPAEGGSPLDAVASAFMADVEKVFRDPNMSPADKAKKFREFAAALEAVNKKLNPETPPADDTDPPSDPPAESDKAMESLQQSVKTLESALATLTKREAARSVLAEANVNATPALLTTLLECADETAMRASLAKLTPEQLGRTKPSLTRVSESTAAPAKTYAEFVSAAKHGAR